MEFGQLPRRGEILFGSIEGLDMLHILEVLLIALMEPPEIGLMEPLASGRLRGLGGRPN